MTGVKIGLVANQDHTHTEEVPPWGRDCGSERYRKKTNSTLFYQTRFEIRIERTVTEEETAEGVNKELRVFSKTPRPYRENQIGEDGQFRPEGTTQNKWEGNQLGQQRRGNAFTYQLKKTIGYVVNNSALVNTRGGVEKNVEKKRREKETALGSTSLGREWEKDFSYTKSKKTGRSPLTSEGGKWTPGSHCG